MSKIALVTGATAGIGKATAELLVKKGYRVIITGRREHVLNEIADRLLLQHNGSVLALNFDIRNKAEVDAAIDGLPEDWKAIDVLINNAGLAAGLSAIQDGDNQDWEQMIDTNIKGLLYISKAVSQGMIERKSGHIINIGSIAGREVYPNGNVYCATKHAVDALTKAMRVDMLEYGIKVTQIAPGAVETEFSMVRFKGDEEKANAVYDGYTPLKAIDIAETIEFVLSRPSHVNINDMLIMPTAQASAHALHREQPDENEW
jgi:NADP-dependent 3-hydroxy acid dehydrogenase YdfG